MFCFLLTTYPRRCLIFQGETYAQREATEIFFAMTKLFQHQDTNMRKMMYLTIKAMSTMADDVIIVTSSLTKDMTGKTDAYRAGAIRVCVSPGAFCKLRVLPLPLLMRTSSCAC